MRIGQTIREKYRLDQVLGVGGMAAVYVATHRNGSRAAFKILHSELAVHNVHRERFIREAYVANSIRHPGAVRVIDDDVAEDNCPFLVMELLEGETLEARRRRLGRLEFREVLRFAHSLCDTLSAAHEQGVVHRDIKPENIFFTNHGTLKILDFGIARVFHEASALGTRTGAMMGTPAFMPPEQALGRRAEIDPRTDIWAVGATMFTLLSGQFVHQAESPEEMMVRAATQPARSLVEVLPEVPLSIAAIVDHALAFARDERFVSARVMGEAIKLAHQDAFDETLEAIPIPSGPPNFSPISVRFERKSASSLVTLAAGGSPEAESLPTVVDSPSVALRSDDAPTVVEVGGVQPSAAGRLGAVPKCDSPGEIKVQSSTTVHSNPRAHRLGELVPPLSRAPRRHVVVGAVAAVAALVSVPVGLRHGMGGPVDTRAQVRLCSPGTECLPGERCDERGQCSTNVGCVSNASCIVESGGKPAICRRHSRQCVLLETAQCRVFAEKTDLENDETIWLGAMYPERDKSTTYGRDALLAVDLARHDFSTLTGGLPPLKPGGHPRPIAVVACDDTEDYELAARHLIDVVGVPAIQGFGRSKEVLELASRHFIPKGIFALASNTASMLSSITHEPGQPRLVYRVTSHTGLSVFPRVELVRDVIEANLRRKGGPLPMDGPLKIAILRTDNVSGTSSTDAVVERLAKRPYASRTTNDDVRPFVFSDSMKRELDANDEKIIQEVISFAPHIVLDSGAPEEVYALVEQKWPASERHRPSYVVSHGLSSELMRKLALMHPTVPKRLFSTDIYSLSPTTRKFTVHFNGFYHENRTTDSLNAAPYDAFYIFAYAAMSLGQETIHGTNLARAVKRLLPPGEPVDVGPSGILPAFKVLAAGGTINLDGAQTNIDFDLETGDPSCDFEVNCFDRKTYKSIWGGLIFRTQTGKLEGTWQCP